MKRTKKKKKKKRGPGKVFKSGLSNFFKGCLPQNLLSPLLNILSQIDVSNEQKGISQRKKATVPSEITRQKRKIRDCNWIRTHNHLVRKRTLSHLAKLA